MGTSEDANESVATVGQAVALGSDSLQTFAAKCDAAIGVSVPDFNCEVHADGTPVASVPTTHFTSSGVGIAAVAANYRAADTRCDRPNMLNQECDPESKFQVLFNDPGAVIVAHCRKKGAQVGKYVDIAVIQYNKKSGATCFYQNTLTEMSGVMPAPKTGSSVWQSPNVNLAGDACINCHDDGPIIRSPYLAQITGRDALPDDIFPKSATADEQKKRLMPYYFVGNDFASWRTYEADVPGGVCVSCHRLARNNRSNDSGTAIDFAQRATASTLPHKTLAFSADSPPWMIPGQTSFRTVDRTWANQVTSCAQSPMNSAMPYNSTCRVGRLSHFPQAAAIGTPLGWERQDKIGDPGKNSVIYQNSGTIMELASTDGGQFSLTNLTTARGLPNASSALTAGVTSDSFNVFYYRSGQHLWEISYKSGVQNNWTAYDASAAANAIAAVGDPAAYRPPYLETAIVSAIGSTTDSIIGRYEVNKEGTHWSFRDLTTASGAPKGRYPVGFMTSDGWDDVIFVDFSGQIWELSSQDGVSWGAYNVSSHAGARPALGVARPYRRSDGKNAIVYRDNQNHISELAYTPGPGASWVKRDLFADAGIGSRTTFADAFPYVRADGTNAVLFLDTGTQHLYELDRGPADYRVNNWTWTAVDLRLATGVPSNPLVYNNSSASGYVRSDGVSAVVFRGSGSPVGKVYQLRFSDGAWQPYDATTDLLTPNGP